MYQGLFFVNGENVMQIPILKVNTQFITPGYNKTKIQKNKEKTMKEIATHPVVN